MLALLSDSAAPTVAREDEVDYAETARVATEAFATPGKVFSANRMRWLYNNCFSRGTTVVAVHAAGRKVGQIALIHQLVDAAGVMEQAVLLSDLFVLKPFRSRQMLSDLFGQVLDISRHHGTRFILGMPNARAQPINVRYLDMAPYLKLDVRVGTASPLAPVADIETARFGEGDPSRLIDLLSRYELSPHNAVVWDPARLYSRHTGNDFDYALHANARLLLISSHRVWRGLPYTLICGLFPGRDASPTGADVRHAVRAACRTHRRAVFVYAGRDTIAPALPGRPVPDAIRPSPMTLDLRDLQPGGAPLHLARYQLTDFDFA